MTKENARAILEEWISNKTADRFGEHKDITLPVVDEIVYTTTFESEINQWTFVGLLKLIYNLENTTT